MVVIPCYTFTFTCAWLAHTRSTTPRRLRSVVILSSRSAAAAAEHNGAVCCRRPPLQHSASYIIGCNYVVVDVGSWCCWLLLFTTDLLFKNVWLRAQLRESSFGSGCWCWYCCLPLMEWISSGYAQLMMLWVPPPLDERWRQLQNTTTPPKNEK